MKSTLFIYFIRLHFFNSTLGDFNDTKDSSRLPSYVVLFIIIKELTNRGNSNKKTRSRNQIPPQVSRRLIFNVYMNHRLLPESVNSGNIKHTCSFPYAFAIARRLRIKKPALERCTCWPEKLGHQPRKGNNNLRSWTRDYYNIRSILSVLKVSNSSIFHASTRQNDATLCTHIPFFPCLLNNKLSNN